MRGAGDAGSEQESADLDQDAEADQEADHDRCEHANSLLLKHERGKIRRSHQGTVEMASPTFSSDSLERGDGDPILPIVISARLFPARAYRLAAI